MPPRNPRVLRAVEDLHSGGDVCDAEAPWQAAVDQLPGKRLRALAVSQPYDVVRDRAAWTSYADAVDGVIRQLLQPPPFPPPPAGPPADAGAPGEER